MSKKHATIPRVCRSCGKTIMTDAKGIKEHASTCVPAPTVKAIRKMFRRMGGA